MEQNLTILHIETGHHLYGGALQVLYLMRQLRQQFQVNNILVCAKGAAIAEPARAWAQVFELTMGGEADVLSPWRIGKVIAHTAPQIVHIHSRRGADLWGVIAASRYGVKTVCTRRVDNPEHRLLARWRARRVSAFAAISNAVKEAMVASGITPEHIHLIRSAVDTTAFQPGKNDYLSRNFGLTSSDITVGMVAQLIPRKGHAMFFDVLPELLKRHPNIKVLVLGQGPQLEPLRSQLEQYGIEQRVIFAGFRTDIESIIPNLDLVVHPATAEGLGVCLLQAAACAVPVVAYRAGGVPEAVAHEQTGLLVEPGDANALMLAINKILDNPKLKAQLAAQARKRVEAEFSVQVMGQSYYRLYQDLLRIKNPLASHQAVLATPTQEITKR